MKSTPIVLFLGMMLAGCQSLDGVTESIKRIGNATGAVTSSYEGLCDGLDPYAPLVVAVKERLPSGKGLTFLNVDPTTKVQLLDQYSDETIRLGHLLYAECWATNKNIRPDRSKYLEETYGRNKQTIIAG